MAKITIGYVLLQSLLLMNAVNAQGDYFPPRQNTGDCRTPNGATGICLSILGCPPLLNMLTTRPLSPASAEFLRHSQCGFVGPNEPKVCCPNANNNPVNPNNGNDGRDSTNGNINLRNNPLLNADCGLDLSLRIVGGEITDLDEFPWMTLLEYSKPTGLTTACGGVLISRRYVMTAAHCVKGKDLPKTWTLTGVRLGEYDTSTDRDCVQDTETTQKCADPPVTIGIEEQITHEQYRPNARDQRNDIALLRLSRDVQFTNYIQPICLPTNATFAQKLYVAGWGKTETKSESNVKLKLGLSLADPDACTQRYRNAGVNLGAGQVCAGGLRGKDSCRGDSGGPLMQVERTSTGAGRWIAVGIVSFGPSPCGMQGWPGVYTKVIDYVPWALSKMRP